MKKWENNKKVLFFTSATTILVLAAMVMVNIFLGGKLALEQTALSDTKSYKYHVAMIGKNPSDDFWVSIYEGARKEGEEKNAYVENFGSELTTSYSVEERMRMAIAAKVDGIVLEVECEEDLVSLIEDASNAGIPVMTILSDAPKSKRISFVSSNDYAVGEIYGNQIIEEVQKQGGNTDSDEKIRIMVLIDSGESNSPPSLIYSSIRECVAPVADEIELSAVLIDNSRQFESEETIRNLVLRKDYPQILVTLSTVDTIGAYQSVVDYNMVGKIALIGYYSSPDILEMIQKGIVKSTVSVNAEEMGKTVADGICEYLSTRYISEYLPVTAELIDANNVEEYIKRTEEEKAAEVDR